MRCSSSDVGEPRHIVEGERLLGEEARDHQRQRRVLRPGNRNRAVEPPAADNAYAIHHHPRGNLPLIPQALLAASIAAKVGTLFVALARHDVIAAFILGAAARLRLTALQVFPQRRGEPRLASRLLFLFTARNHH